MSIPNDLSYDVDKYEKRYTNDLQFYVPIGTAVCSPVMYSITYHKLTRSEADNCDPYIRNWSAKNLYQCLILCGPGIVTGFCAKDVQGRTPGEGKSLATSNEDRYAIRWQSS